MSRFGTGMPERRNDDDDRDGRMLMVLWDRMERHEKRLEEFRLDVRKELSDVQSDVRKILDLVQQARGARGLANGVVVAGGIAAGVVGYVLGHFEYVGPIVQRIHP